MKIILPFLAGILLVVAIQGSLSRFEAQVTPPGMTEETVHTGVKCTTDVDCPDPVDVCGKNGACVPLQNPEYSCSQPMVLTVKEASTERAKHTFCKKGCRNTDSGPTCVQ